MPAAPLVVTHHGPTGARVPRVVLVHGAPDRSRSWKLILPLLTDLAVDTYDRRGYGDSIDVRPAATSLADHADDLIAVLDERPATIIGHSFGSNVVYAAAVRRPDLVRSLGCWEPPMAWADWWPTPDLLANAREMAADPDPEALGERFGRSLGRWDEMSEWQRRMFIAEGRAFRADMASQIEAPYDERTIPRPSVIATGTVTSVGHTEAAWLLGARIGAEVVEVPGAGHFGHVTHPADFVGMIRRAVALGWPEAHA